MFRRDSLAEAPCEAISDSGIGVGAGFAGLGFDVTAEDCWPPAMSPLTTQQNVMNKPIRIILRIGAKSELFGDRTVRAARSILHRVKQV